MIRIKSKNRIAGEGMRCVGPGGRTGQLENRYLVSYKMLNLRCRVQGCCRDVRILQEFSHGFSDKPFGTFRIFSDKKASVNYARIKRGEILDHKMMKTGIGSLPIDKRP